MAATIAFATASEVPAQDAPASPIVYRISATFRPDSLLITATARLLIPHEARTSDGTVKLRMRISSSGAPTSTRPQTFLRALDERGNALPVRVTPESSLVAVRMPTITTRRSPLRLTVEYGHLLNASHPRDLGYYLVSSTDTSNSWYPEVMGLPDSLARYRDFHVDFRYPTGWAVLSSGEESKGSVALDTVLSQFSANHVEGFMLAIGRGYAIHTVDALEDIKIKVFTTPELKDKMLAVGAETAAAAAWYRRVYGFLPRGRLYMGIVPGSAGASGGFPLPNVFMIHRGDLSPDFVRWITAHELGHYYWGLYALDPEERLGWLMLANSIWADHLYLAERAGHPLELEWRRGVQGNYFLGFAIAQTGNYDQRLGIGESEEQRLAFDYNSHVRHAKGAVGLYLLARQIGPERFLAVQRDLLSRYAYRVLPESAFVSALERAGVVDAGRFVTSWRRGDARIGYRIAAVRQDSGATPFAYRVVIARTGTVDADVDVELRGGTRTPVKQTLRPRSALDSISVRLDGPISEVRLDPDGELPMLESSHPEIRRLFIRALYGAGYRDAFLDAALPWLTTYPDPDIRALVVTYLFDIGRFDRIIALISDQLDSVGCNTRAECLAALLVARALTREKRSADSARLLERLRVGARDFSLDQRWSAARAEIGG